MIVEAPAQDLETNGFEYVSFEEEDGLLEGTRPCGLLQPAKLFHAPAEQTSS